MGEGDADGVTSFTGTVESEISTTEDAIASGCPESAGVRSYEVEVVRAE
ncbi:MAG TPA: hypothetical protein VNR36_12170 [Pseudolysinimonas sp.]|nr:hypothetical protein [Pseudolysinimonas sp.]